MSTREVKDRIGFADGWNIPLGREVYENYEAKVTIDSGKHAGATLRASGKLGKASFFGLQTTGKAKGYYRLGNGYVGKAVYDVAMALIAELEAELPKSEEQLQLEAAQAEAEKRQYVEVEPKHGEHGYCRKCHSYCYGDCEAN